MVEVDLARIMGVGRLGGVCSVQCANIVVIEFRQEKHTFIDSFYKCWYHSAFQMNQQKCVFSIYGHNAQSCALDLPSDVYMTQK